MNQSLQGAKYSKNPTQNDAQRSDIMPIEYLSHVIEFIFTKASKVRLNVRKKNCRKFCKFYIFSYDDKIKRGIKIFASKDSH